MSQWSPDGTTLISGDDVGFLQAWSAADGTLQYNVSAHVGFIAAVDVSRDGVITSMGSDGDVKTWAVSDGSALSSATTGQSQLLSGRIPLPGHRVAVGGDPRVDVYDIDSMTLLTSLAEPSLATVRGVAWNAAATQVFAGDTSRNIWLWDNETRTASMTPSSTPSPSPTASRTRTRSPTQSPTSTSSSTSTSTPSSTSTLSSTSTPSSTSTRDPIVNEALVQIATSSGALTLSGTSTYTSFGAITVVTTTTYTATAVIQISGGTHTFTGSGSMDLQEGATMQVDGVTEFAIPIVMTGAVVTVTAKLTFSAQVTVSGGTMTVSAAATVTYSPATPVLSNTVLSGGGASIFSRPSTGLMLLTGVQWALSHTILQTGIARRTDLGTIVTQSLCGAQHGDLSVGSGTALLAYLNCTAATTPQYSSTIGTVTFASGSYLILEQVNSASLPLYMAGVSAASGVQLEVISETTAVPFSVAIVTYVHSDTCPFAFSNTTFENCPDGATCTVTGVVDSSDSTLCTLVSSQALDSDNGLVYLAFLSLLVLPLAGLAWFGWRRNSMQAATFADANANEEIDYPVITMLSVDGNEVSPYGDVVPTPCLPFDSATGMEVAGYEGYVAQYEGEGVLSVVGNEVSPYGDVGMEFAGYEGHVEYEGKGGYVAEY